MTARISTWTVVHGALSAMLEEKWNPREKLVLNDVKY